MDTPKSTKRQRIRHNSQRSVSDAFSYHGPRQEVLYTKIILCITETMLALKIVDSLTFRDLIETCLGGTRKVTVPSRRHLGRLIHNEYARHKSALIKWVWLGRSWCKLHEYCSYLDIFRLFVRSFSGGRDISLSIILICLPLSLAAHCQVWDTWRPLPIAGPLTSGHIWAWRYIGWTQ